MSEEEVDETMRRMSSAEVGLCDMLRELREQRIPWWFAWTRPSGMVYARSGKKPPRASLVFPDRIVDEKGDVVVKNPIQHVMRQDWVHGIIAIEKKGFTEWAEKHLSKPRGDE